MFGAEYTPLRVGRLTRVVLRAEDPDGDPLRFSIEPLPSGASFDAETGHLTWRPAAPGRHELEFSVSDGSAVDRRVLVFSVGANRAPAATGDDALVVRPGGGARTSDLVHTQSGSSTSAHDPDADAVSFQAQSLPPGARLELSANGSGVELHFRPTDEQAGEHEVVFDVSDGELTTRVRRRVIVLPSWAARQSNRWLLAGAGPVTFLTPAEGELLLGGAFDVSLAAIRSSGLDAVRCADGERDECAGSHHRFYAELEVLDSLRAGAPSLFTYGLGYSASLQLYPARRYLIPHYGVEVGGVVRRGTGHLPATRPYLGLHLFVSDDVWFNAVVGYRIVPSRLAELSGATLGLKVVLAPL